MSPDLLLLVVFLLGLLTGMLAEWQWARSNRRNKEFDAWVRRIR